MYIDPFLAGVLATIFVELGALTFFAIVKSVGGNDENEDRF